jgi:hypothetical protein
VDLTRCSPVCKKRQFDGRQRSDVVIGGAPRADGNEGASLSRALYHSKDSIWSRRVRIFGKETALEVVPDGRNVDCKK